MGEHIVAHIILQDVFVIRDVGFHVSHKQTHVISLFSLWFSHQCVDIMFALDRVHTLGDVIIVNPI
jgi:hypothetical protein